ncbi:MAG: Ig-like domain-containing protein, partial [Nitrososphaerales archaeon]
PQARVDVQLYSSDLGVGRIESLASILPGETFAVASFNSTGQVGQTTITAISQGFVTGVAVINTFVLPLSISIGIQGGDLGLGQETLATVTVKGSGGPLANAEVSWSSIGVQIISSQPMTDENGMAVARIAGLGVGEASLSAKATKLSYGPSSASANLFVTETESRGLLDSISINLLLIGGTAMPLSLLGIWGVMRMKKKRKSKNLF